MSRTIVGCVIALIACAALEIGAQREYRFEVASIKPNRSSDTRASLGNQSGGRFFATNLPISALIQFAYQIQDFQLTGGPAWSIVVRTV